VFIDNVSGRVERGGIPLYKEADKKILKVKGITDSVLQEWLNIKGNWKLQE